MYGYCIHREPQCWLLRTLRPAPFNQPLWSSQSVLAKALLRKKSVANTFFLLTQRSPSLDGSQAAHTHARASRTHTSWLYTHLGCSTLHDHLSFNILPPPSAPASASSAAPLPPPPPPIPSQMLTKIITTAIAVVCLAGGTSAYFDVCYYSDTTCKWKETFLVS